MTIRKAFMAVIKSMLATFPKKVPNYREFEFLEA
jgi:hypothetical protein